MGIRIHKVMGYGLRDVKTKKDRLNDPRFNPESVFFSSEQYDDPKFSRKAFLKFMLEESKNYGELDQLFIKLAHQRISEMKTWQPYQSLIYDNEYGLKNVFLAIPPDEYSQFYRYDDLLDYYGEQRDAGPRNHIKMIHGYFYPHAKLIDARTGKPVNDSFSFAFLRALSSKDASSMEILAKAMKKEMGDDFEPKKHMVAIKPVPLELLLRFFKVFKDPVTIWTLRPMIYTYWS